MKTQWVLPMVLLIFLCGCKESILKYFKKDRTTEISILADKTDSYITAPDPEELLSIYNFSNDNIYRGVHLRYRQISDRAMTEVSRLDVDAVVPLFADPNQRISALKSFKDKLRHLFDSETPAATKSHSQIYRTAANEANILYASAADEKYLIIYSDMLDHGDLDFYDPRVINLINNHPDQVMNMMDRIMPIKSLKGINVLIIFNPSTFEQEQKFIWSSSFYKAFFEAKGARVVIAPNIIADN